MALTILASLLFATAVLFASPTNAALSCDDDPAFVLKNSWKPLKDGAVRNCDWIKTLEKKKRNWICNRKDGKNENRKKVKKICPAACDYKPCKEKPDPVTQCPEWIDENSEGGDCSKYKPGLSCDYNYKYFGGCGAEAPLNCYPSNTYICDDKDSFWIKTTFLDLPCVTELTIKPGVGESCEPCPEVSPEDICPPEKPEGGKSCDLEEGTTCNYDFEVTGCSPEDLQCTPLSLFFCSSGEWMVIMTLPVPCPIKINQCPDSPPAHDSSCTAGLSCPYDYRNTSCDEGIEICSPHAHYDCTETNGWAYAISDFFCESQNYPDGHYDECDPSVPSKYKKCPDSPPANYSSCTAGLSCPYDYRNTSCEEGKEICSPTAHYDCTETNGWALSISDFFCESQNYPDSHYDECDPSVPSKKSDPV